MQWVRIFAVCLTILQQENKVNEEQKDWLQSAYNTLQKAWREGDKNTTTVTFVPEELQALEDAITLALEL